MEEKTQAGKGEAFTDLPEFRW